MPDNFGNPTPQEAMQAIIMQREQAIAQARTPSERRLTSLYFQAQAMGQGMDPRVTKAADIQRAVQPSQNLEQEEGESTLDFQVRQARQLVDDLREADPRSHALAQQQLRELEEERFSRTRLMAADDRAASNQRINEERAEREATRARNESLVNGTVRFFNPETQQLTDDVVFKDDPLAMQKIQRLIEERGLIEVDRAAVERIGLNTAPGDINAYLKSDFQTQREDLRASGRVVGVASKLAEVFVDAVGNDGFNPVSDFARVDNGLTRAFNAIREGRRALGFNVPEFGSERYRRDLSDAERFRQERRLPESISASLLTHLAYTFALMANDRVTDADFDNAMNMIGGQNGDPRLILENISALVGEDHRFATGWLKPEFERMVSDPRINATGKFQGEVLLEQMGFLEEEMSTFDGLLGQLNDLLDPNARDIDGPGASETTVTIPGLGGLAIE